jgi:hypothetical protein
MLAACGLLYAIAATSPEIDATDLVKANAAVEKIAYLANREGHAEAVSAAMWKLVARFKEYPAEVGELAETVGPTCRLIAGL